MTEGKMVDRASKSRPPPPPPLAQGLDLPLLITTLFNNLVLTKFNNYKQIFNDQLFFLELQYIAA